MGEIINIKYDIATNTYTLTNNSDIAVPYSIFKINPCAQNTLYSEGEIGPGESIEFILLEDGDYEIIPERFDIVYIKHYLKLKKSIIRGMLNNICDCKCGCECLEDKNECCDLLTLRAKVDLYKQYIIGEDENIVETFKNMSDEEIFAAFKNMSDEEIIEVFKSLSDEKIVEVFKIVTDEIKCLVKKPIYCGIDEEIILGDSKFNIKVVKQMLALDYLAMYYSDIMTAKIQGSSIEDLDVLYETEIIFCCIQTLGIDLKKIQGFF